MAESNRHNESFALTWIAWEAYLERAVVLSIAAQGMTIKDARVVRSRVGKRGYKPAQEILPVLVSTPLPSQTGKVGDTWRRLESTKTRTKMGSRTYRGRRNDLIHGSKGLKPEVARVGNELIFKAIADDIFQMLQIRQLTALAETEPLYLGRLMCRRNPRVDLECNQEKVVLAIRQLLDQANSASKVGDRIV